MKMTLKQKKAAKKAKSNVQVVAPAKSAKEMLAEIEAMRAQLKIQVKEEAQEEKRQADEAKAKAKMTAPCKTAVLSSEIYTRKTGSGVKSRKVYIRSDQTSTRRTKNGPIEVPHETMLKEADIVALARIIDQCGAEGLAEVILAAREDRDLQVVG